MKVFGLFGLFVSFAFATNNAAVYPPLTDSHLLTVGTDEQFTADQIFQIVFKPLPSSVHFSKYGFYSDFPFPHEIWLEILGRTDLMAIWNFGLTCKWAAALIRDRRNGINQIWAVPENLGQLLLNGELRIHNWAANFLEPFLHIWAGNIIDPMALTSPEQWELLYQKWYQLCSRSADLKIAQIAFRVFNLSGFHASCLIHLSDHLYGDYLDFSRSFYLPPNDGVLLFQRIDPRLIAGLAHRQYSYQRNRRFAIPLLLDYVIPSYRDWHRITPTERDMLCFILPQQYDGLKDYMRHLLWALYLHTGTLRKNEKTVISHVVRHFEGFNLEWKKLCGGQSATKKFESLKHELNEHQVKTIYIVAKQWKLDLIKIAKNSSWFPLSKQILAGVFPDYLTNNAPGPSCVDLYKYIYLVEPSKFYEDDDEPIKEPAAKRQRFGDAPIQDASIMPRINQIQMEVDATTEAHPSSLVSENNVSDEQMVEEIMSKIAWLREIIPDSVALMNQQGSVVDVNDFVQTLNSLESTVQNILPQLTYGGPQIRIQNQYDPFYGPNSSYQQFQHAPVYPQVQQMHHYPQAQQTHAYIPQAQLMQQYVPQVQHIQTPIQHDVTHQQPLPQWSQLVQEFTNKALIENIPSNQDNDSVKKSD